VRVVEAVELVAADVFSAVEKYPRNFYENDIIEPRRGADGQRSSSGSG
jgi:hypothetical protein